MKIWVEKLIQHLYDAGIMQRLCRQSLVLQVEQILRDGIQCGEWKKSLPSERILEKQLCVSRTTIRLALHNLVREGIILVQHGRKTRIHHPRFDEKKKESARKIGILMEKTFGFLSGWRFILEELRNYLRSEGLELEIHDQRLDRIVDTNCYLREMVAESQARCWILVGSSLKTQQWFSQSSVDVILAGSCHRGLLLPHVDFDYRAICRHAAQTLLKQGHRQLALLVPQSRLAGDERSENGFCEALAKCGDESVDYSTVRHDGTALGIQRQIRLLMQSKTPPTAWVVSGGVYVLSAIHSLLRMGFRIPEDVSVIARDHEIFLDYLTPTVACYVADWSLFGKRLARMTIQMMKARSVSRKEVLLFPKFQNGESLGRSQPRPNLENFTGVQSVNFSKKCLQ